MQIITYRGTRPSVHPGAWIAPGVTLIGDVEIGDESSVWFGTVMRGDVHSIRMGQRSNVQDNCVVHVAKGVWPTVIGNDVTVGHGVVVHGCVVGDGCLIGIGSTILDGAVIGAESLVAAGSVVKEGFEVPPRSLVVGVPAVVKREVTDDELGRMRQNSLNYLEYARTYRLEANRGE